MIAYLSVFHALRRRLVRLFSQLYTIDFPRAAGSGNKTGALQDISYNLQHGTFWSDGLGLGWLGWFRFGSLLEELPQWSSLALHDMTSFSAVIIIDNQYSCSIQQISALQNATQPCR